MKTKTKMIAMVEIAIMLCSMFLVAIPAIAADQTTQEVSASSITAASEDDYVLGIYGNANEDDTIDMGDVVYTKLAIFGKKSKTELCDAKYDGRINVLDVIQTKLIILGKEKELTIVQYVGEFLPFTERVVTVHKPVQRTVHADRKSLELTRIIKVEKNRIVGVGSSIQRGDWKMLFPEYQDIPTVGGSGGGGAVPDTEAILTLNPDAVFLSRKPSSDAAAAVLESAGIAVIREWWAPGGLWRGDTRENVKKFGYIFDKQDEAEEFCDFLNKYMNPLKKTVKEIPEGDKPKVYLESSRYSLQENAYGDIAIAGGKDIFADLNYFAGDIKVDPEAVVQRDPEIIVNRGWKPKGAGYGANAGETAGLEEIRDEIMSRPELQNVKAVKDGRVYVMTGYIQYGGPASGCRGFLGTIYMAKWFHPELFEDLDPKAIHQEYLTEFLEVDIDLDEKGVFVYPEPS